MVHDNTLNTMVHDKLQVYAYTVCLSVISLEQVCQNTAAATCEGPAQDNTAWRQPGLLVVRRQGLCWFKPIP